MRSRDSLLFMTVMGLVLRLTSRKTRSMGFIVRRVARRAGGSWKWANNASRSLSMHCTALGSSPRQRSAQRQKAAIAVRRLWAS